MSWLDDAACSGYPLDMFFPTGRVDDRRRREAVAAATRVCQRCSVRSQCAQFALDADVRHGVFAGVDLGDSHSIKSAASEKMRRDLKQIAAQSAQSSGGRRVVVCGCGRSFTTKQARLTKCRPCIQGLTEVAPVRAHLNTLRSDLTYAEISELTGVPVATLSTIGYRQFVKIETADLILGVRLAVA